MKKLRKAFISSVMFTTIFALSGVAAVSPAQAAASAGDLIKMDGLDTVYYLGADGKRYVFPNAQTYFSWYSDFSSVVTVPQSELESYRLGSNVTMRAGTKLVKITTDPTVYAVEPGGNLRSIVSEENAIALYGANWASRVIDVPDAFFTNYEVQSDLTPGMYPAGQIVSSGGNNYYFDGTNYRMVSGEAAMTANRFQASDVVATTMAVTAGGTAIAGAEADLIDTSSSGATVGITPGAGTGVSVSLASNTAMSSTTIIDSNNGDGAQAMVPVMTVNLTAAADGDVQVNTLKFKRGGIPSSDTDFAEFYLYDGSMLIAEYSSISSGVLSFTNSSGLFNVPAGSTKSVTLRVNLDDDADSSRAFNFSLMNASDIVTNGAAVSGSFPVTSNTMSTARVFDLGKLTLAHSTNSTNPDPGTDAHTLWKFTANATDQDIQIEKMKFTVIGTVDASDLANFKLDAGGTQLGSVVTAMASDKTITFDMSANPYLISKGNTKTISLKGDVKNGTSRTYQVYLYDKEDVVAKDMEYGVYVTPNQEDTWTRISAAAASTISSGSLTVSKNTSSPTGNVALGATDVEIARFDFQASGEDIKIDSINHYVDMSASTGLYQVKMYIDGAQVGQANDVPEITADSVDLGNSFIIPAGTTKTLVVKADIKEADSTDTTADETIAFQLGNTTSASYTLQSSGGTGTTGAVTSNTLTVRTGTVTVSKNPSFGDKTSSLPTGTVNATDVRIGSFVVTAGSGEAVDLTQITLKDADGTSQVGDNFQNLKIKHDGTQIGSTVSSPDNSGTQATYDFDVSPMVRLAAGEQYVIDVYADIKGTPQDSATSLSPAVSFDNVTATGVTTTSDASYATDVTLQTAYISAAGTLTVTIDGDTTLSDQLVMGATDQELAKFKFESSASEAITISELIVSDNVSSAATGTLMNLKLYDGATLIAGPIQLSATSATTTYANAVFSNLDINIPASQNKVLTVKGDVSTYDNGATSESTHTLAILANNGSGTDSVTARGASSGTTLSSVVSSDQSGSQMEVFRTKLTVTWASDTPSGASAGAAAQTIAKINVTNSSNSGNYAATVKNMNFAISSTVTAAGGSRQLDVYKSALGTTALANTTYPNINFADSAITEANFTDVEIAAGTTKLFLVTLDTNDATSDENLSIYVDSSDITWNDGVNDTTSIKSLPLTPKTITY